MDATSGTPRAEISVDLGAIRHNVRRLRDLVSDGGGSPALLVVVKADGYGHGMLPVARAARAAGAEWLGVATLDEAIALRDDGDTGRVLCWLAVPGEDFGPVVRRGVDVTASSVRQLDEILDAARREGVRARIHLKVDTGLSRNGAPRGEWPALVAAAVAAAPAADVVGVWSHFACSDQPDHPANAAQEAAFREAVALAEDGGLPVEVRHLANSAGALFRPSARFDLVRLGISVYGLTPAPPVASSTDLGLVPAMTVRARVARVKDLPEGSGVSYGHAYVTDDAAHVALVPLGYGDGIPRHASNRAEVLLGGSRAPVRGRVCMDQFVVDAPGAREGEVAVVFGPGSDGEPTAQEWADWCDTISYEIVTRVGGRAARRWVGE